MMEMEKTNHKSTFTVSDLYQSAYFKAKGIKLLGQSREGQRINFIFEDDGNRERLEQEFFNGGLVNVTAFKSAIQDLKTIIFDKGDRDGYGKNSNRYSY